jgi:3-deoxy-D-manno-octulosonate 8-phosphate phosphatase (KDO 8-P phosphatase)
MLAASGVACAVLSGRRSGAVAARCAELGMEHVLQGIDDKLPAFEKLRASLALPAEECGFMGDEVVDLPVLGRCGFACAPPEARAQVLARVHYVSEALAGRGAAREVCEFVMRAQGTLERALQGSAGMKAGA